MRITEHQRTVVTRALRTQFGQGARIVLFGSRVDDTARGGDIDILVETDAMGPDSEQALAAKFRALSEIQRSIGDRKIDLVITGSSSSREVVRQARATGVPL